MLISRFIHFEDENVNLEKGTPETAPPWSACLRASLVVISNLTKLKKIEAKEGTPDSTSFIGCDVAIFLLP